jgi:hypothetical protein
MHTRAANMDRNGPTDRLRERTARRSIREAPGWTSVARNFAAGNVDGTEEHHFPVGGQDRGARWDRGVETRRSSEAP